FHVRGDLLDLLLRGFAGVAINGGDLDGAVILDLDHRAGFVLDGAHDRTALADDVTDLVDLDLHGDDARRPVGHFLARLADDLVHLFKDVQPCFMRLRQRILHDLGRDAGDLDVHLQGGDAAARTRNLEVHVAEVILVAHDVGEHGVTVAFLHQTHGDTRHRLLDRHAGIHQRQRGAADGSHRAGTVGFGDLGNDANDVRILAHVRHHGLDAALGQAAVADLATLRRTDEAGLAHAVRREVVMEHERLLPLTLDGIDDLGVAAGAERGHHDGLGFSAGEDRRTMGTRQHADLDVDGTDRARVATVDARLAGEDALAHRAVLEIME